MRIEIDHDTVYTYEHPAKYGVQEFRLSPVTCASQTVISWTIDAPGIEGAAHFPDAWGNTVHLVNQVRERSQLPIRVRGVIDTRDTGGIIGTLSHEPASRIFLRETDLTKPGEAITAMAKGLPMKGDTVALCHTLMAAIGESMRFDTRSTDSQTTASQSFGNGSGVCQDFTHVFIAACRVLGLPSRYVTGYLFLPDEPDHSDAHHAWAETEIKGLGWVGFDPANAICPDARYVRLASGPDASYAAPVRGLRRGAGEESLKVAVSVTQAPSQANSQVQAQQ
jgi:transglutaminase-like putative cysteine protease